MAAAWGGGGMMGGGGVMGAMNPEARNRMLRLGNASIAAQLEKGDDDPNNQALLKMLEKPISMSFAVETPLDDVLKYIKQATTAPNHPAYRFTSIPRASRTRRPTFTLPCASIWRAFRSKRRSG